MAQQYEGSWLTNSTNGSPIKGEQPATPPETSHQPERTCWICKAQTPRTEHGWQVYSVATDKELHQFTTCGQGCKEMAAALLDGLLRLRRWQTGAWKYSA